MHRLSRHDVHDRGAVLVITLILCVVLGVIATALATFAATGLMTSKVTDTKNNQVAALDAGLRIGMERIQTNPTTCLAPLNTYSVPQQISGVSLTVACDQIDQSAAWVTYRITSSIADSGSTGVAVVQASTSSRLACLPLAAELVQNPPCQLTINSWAIAN